MSIAFRLKYALGLIPSADQLDAKWEKLIRMRDDLSEMEKSDELKKFEDLKNLVASTTFQQHKREIENLQFSGSKEENILLEFKALVNSAAIKNYKKIFGSDRLNRYHAISEGTELKRLHELQKIVESHEFNQRKGAQKKKEFVKSPDYLLFKEFHQLKASNDIRFWRKFGQSESFRSYLKTESSKELKRLGELKILTASDEFINQVAYLKDKKRYLKSEENKSILAFNEMDKSKFMIEYRKLKKARELDFFEKWEVTFEEAFMGKQLDVERWQPENWWGFKLAGASFSQENERQGYNGIKNVELNNNSLSLWAKKEKVNGQIWSPSIGLMPKQFDYSSAIVNNNRSFHLKEGVLEAKVRFKTDASITSAFSLTGEKPFPQIDLFRSTKNGIGLGIVEQQGKGHSSYARLGGLNNGNYHIFRLERFNNHLVWKINGTEVFRSSFSSKEPLFYHLLTSLHGEVNEHLLPHRFEINWIRCFGKKS